MEADIHRISADLVQSPGFEYCFFSGKAESDRFSKKKQTQGDENNTRYDKPHGKQICQPALKQS